MNNELDFLATSAEGLDLGDEEDRAIFRMRVADRLRATTVEAMREWVACAMRDRHGAVRAVADAYIALQTAPKPAPAAPPLPTIPPLPGWERGRP